MLEILLALFAAVCFGVATAIQKYSFFSMKRFSVRKMIINSRWLASILITLFGAVAYLYALRIVQLSTVQPVLSLALVVPVLAGVLFFKEKTGARKWVSIVLIISGVVLVSIF